MLTYLLVEFLSTGTEPEEEGEKEVVKKDVYAIIEYLEMAIGVGDKAGILCKEGLDKLRKSSLYVVFLVNLPRLLDGNKFYANLFLKIALDTLETGIKGMPANDIMNAKPRLSLLDDNLQHAWLTSLIVVLYKHSIQEASEKESIWKLMNIVKRTIDGHGQHKCHQTRANENLSMSALIGTLKLKDRMFRVRDETILHTRDRGGRVVLDEMPRGRDRNRVVLGDGINHSPEIDNEKKETHFCEETICCYIRVFVYT